jgi:hypothetical protein
MQTKKSTTSKRKKTNASITYKAQDLVVRKAIYRFKSRLKTPVAIDLAVPKSLLSLSPSNSYHTPTRPQIADQHSPCSPFVLSLRQIPSPEEIVDEAFALPGINLLALHEPPQPIPDDLSLSPSDLEEQLAEELFSHRGWSRLTLPLRFPNLSFPSLFPHHSSLTPPPKLKPGATITFSSNELLPQTPPKDIFAYFDFPEEEAEPEADLIDLDEFAPPSVSFPLPTFSFHLPTFPPLHLPHLSTFGLQLGWQRAVASFVAISFLFVLPLHAMNVISDIRATTSSAESQSADAVSLLSQAATAVLARDAQDAQINFALSGEQFNSAGKILETLSGGTRLLLASLPMTQNGYRTGQSLIEAGEELSIAGSELSLGYEAMDTELNPTPISRLDILRAHIAYAKPHLQKANSALDRVDASTVPEQFRDELAAVTSMLPTIITTADEFEQVYPLIESLLGATGSKRYLLLFQNNTEIRPTGGFIGSFAEVKVRDGVIEQLSVPGGGSYDLQGSLSQNLIAPSPLQLLSARWEFQDGNWFPDFPTSSRQLIEFYRDAGGPTVDGVIAVNATFVASLIGLLGSIDMPEYGRVIDEENFIFEAQRIVELEYDREENRPKAFIGDLAPKLVERATQKTSEDFLAVFDFLRQGMIQKDVQFYLAQDDLQREVLARGWGGEMKQTSGDYFMLVDTNLGGGKTDGVIQEKVDLRVDVQDDGSIINTATISRTHFGIQGLLFTGVNNVDYMRLYVPKGSELLSAEGFSVPDVSLFESPDPDWLLDDDLAYAALTQTTHESSGTLVTQEHGKAVFGNWVQTIPGSTSTVRFTYKLPFTIHSMNTTGSVIASIKSLVGLPEVDDYSLMIQKQSGIVDRATEFAITLPDSLKTTWSSHGSNLASFTNHEDAMFAAILEPL